MKKLTLILMIAALAACSQPQQQDKAATPATQNKTVYTCTMHPEVAAEKPGVCPKCGMDLTEKDN